MNTARKLLVLAASAATAVALAGCAAGTPSMNGMDHDDDMMGDDQTSSTAAFDMDDVMFAQMMIPHHEQAVEMSDIVLAADGVDERVTALATQIKAAQQPEIDQLEAWLDEWGVDMGDADDSDDDADSDGMGGMGHGDGMMSDDDLAALEAASGDEASRLFLEQMIVHHEGAIDMAEDEIADGSHAGAVEMAQDIVDTQTAEIQEMRDILATL